MAVNVCCCRIKLTQIKVIENYSAIAIIIQVYKYIKYILEGIARYFSFRKV